jgi:CheY-like chemotaxis protein
MDLHMPIINGCHATEHIKASQDIQTIVIATTATAFAEEVGDIMDCGFDDFVRKPIHTDKVFEILKTYLGVEYIYAVEEETAVPSQLNANGEDELWKTAVAILPEFLQTNLKNAALQTNMLEMDQLITQTSQYQPELAQKFQQLADEFEYGKILTILETS